MDFPFDLCYDAYKDKHSCGKTDIWTTIKAKVSVYGISEKRLIFYSWCKGSEVLKCYDR